MNNNEELRKGIIIGVLQDKSVKDKIIKALEKEKAVASTKEAEKLDLLIFHLGAL